MFGAKGETSKKKAKVRMFQVVLKALKHYRACSLWGDENTTYRLVFIIVKYENLHFTVNHHHLVRQTFLLNTILLKRPIICVNVLSIRSEMR